MIYNVIVQIYINTDIFTCYFLQNGCSYEKNA